MLHERSNSNLPNTYHPFFQQTEGEEKYINNFYNSYCTTQKSRRGEKGQ